MHYADPSGHFSLGKWLGKIIGAIAGVVTTIATGNPMLGFQVYSAISSVYDTGYALAHGADPLRTIGAFVAANVLSAIIPGVPGGLQGDLFAQIAIGAVRGAVIGGLTAAIAGGDIGQGALWGAGTGAAIGFASSQQFQNAIHGNGFVNNATVQQRQQALVRTDLQSVANIERSSALRPLAMLEKGFDNIMARFHKGIGLDTTHKYFNSKTFWSNWTLAAMADLEANSVGVVLTATMPPPVNVIAGTVVGINSLQTAIDAYKASWISTNPEDYMYQNDTYYRKSQ